MACLAGSGCLDSSSGEGVADAMTGGDVAPAESGVGDGSTGLDASDASDATAATDGGDASDACVSCASGACTAGGCDPAVFITSKEYTGMIGDGGVASADAECAALAAAAGLTGTFKAWLGAAGSSPSTRFTSKSARPYRLLNGKRVAASFAGLAGTLDNPISVTEARVDIGFAYAWTAIDGNGTPTPDAGTCAGWTSSDVGIKGGSGESDDTVSEWTSFGDIPCTTMARLYCFEERP
jgi:hypothetical protein